jgi:FG-GAP-like repeat/FG-GAP repeat
MTLRSWLCHLFASRTPRTPRKAAARCRPSLEALEDRAVLSVTFAPAVTYGAGGTPVSVAVGDFNGDSKPDLATANLGNVSVLLGQGDGTFQGAVNYGAGDGPRSVAVGDFNADGKQDLATANGDDNTVSVLLGKGDGSFHSAVSFGTGVVPLSVAVGDFNGDGRQDLATANGDDDTVSLLLGNGDGSFQSAVSFSTGDGPGSVAVGDFNGDGGQDLATTNRDSSNVSVLMQARAISVALVKRQVGPRLRLFVQVFYADGGELKAEIRSPFQRPAFRKIVARAIDTNGDGITDAVKLTARKVSTNQLVRRILLV